MLKKIIILLLFMPFIGFSQNQTQIKSKIDSILRLPDDTVKVDEINNLIWKINQYDSANCEFLAKKSIEIAKKLNYFSGIATAQKNLASYYYYTANYDRALELYNLSLANYETAKNKKGIAISYRNIGNIYSQLGNWKMAIDFFLKSQKIREDLKDSSGIANIFNAIGLVYSNMKGSEDSSLAYFKKALKIFQKLKDNFNISSTFINLSTIYYTFFRNYSDSNKLDSSEYFAFKSLKYSKIINDLRLQALCFESIGQCKLDKNELDSAYYYLNNSLILRRATNNLYGIANSLNKIGLYFLTIANYKQAEINLLEANKISEDQNFAPVLEENLYYLATLYSKTGKYKLAYEAFLKSTKIKDSLQTQDKTKEITQLSMQYEFDKQKKLEELEQQKKDAIKEATLKRQKQITILAFAAFLLAIITSSVIYRSYRQKKKINHLLQQKNERIILQNEELEQQKEEIEVQRDEIERQKLSLEQSNKEITQSINYAQRIQSAMLNFNFFAQNFQNFFILFKPRNIVSGDFFWGAKINQKLIVIAADCTGHGVPGAFMSMLGISFLNQIVEQQLRFKEDFRASEIINKMRELVVQTLGSSIVKEENLQDGMDMSLTIIDLGKKYINFAGAYNPLYLLRNNEIQIIPADRMPVGYHFAKMNDYFTDKFIDLQNGDKLYMFSDGFADQMGGPQGRKISPANFRDILIKNNNLPFVEQKKLLGNFIEDWMVSASKQTDDILVIGLEMEI